MYTLNGKNTLFGIYCRNDLSTFYSSLLFGLVKRWILLLNSHNLFHCYLTHYHKFSSVKQDLFIYYIIVSMGQKFGHNITECWAQGLTRLKTNQDASWSVFSSRAHLGSGSSSKRNFSSLICKNMLIYVHKIDQGVVYWMKRKITKLQ
jgi:hypothetical protein